MRAFVGTSGYNYDEWKGLFYPEALSKTKRLSHYAQHFASVEINYTFTNTPSEKALANWLLQTPETFRFSLKAPQQITHHRRLVGVTPQVRAFVRLAGALGPRLAPILFQLPPNLKADLPRLKTFLRHFRKHQPQPRAAFEFRHASWFSDDTYALLRDAGVALCIADTDALTTPLVATADYGYVRLRRLDYT